MLSGSADADAISPFAGSNISCQPEAPEAYVLLVAQACREVKLLNSWLFYPHPQYGNILPLFSEGIRMCEVM